MDTETDTSPQMQQFVEQLAQHHGVNLYTAQSELWLHHRERQEALLISNTDGRCISVAHCVVQNALLYLDLDMVFLINTDGKWFPMELCYTASVWDEYVFNAEVMGGLTIENEKGEVLRSGFIEFHAAQWRKQGWLDYGQRYDLSIALDTIGGDHDSRS